jgi:CheY-like chemotaxis protein
VTVEKVEEEAENSNLRILLAEDDQVNQLILLHLLEQQGHRADVVEDGLEALKALEEKSYDVVLLDVQMPKLDGLATVRQIRQKWGRETPWVIAVTANAVRGDRETCLAAGMNDYLTKPVTPEGLAAALDRRTGQ